MFVFMDARLNERSLVAISSSQKSLKEGGCEETISKGNLHLKKLKRKIFLTLSSFSSNELE
jgi:hypothetical protein